MILIDISSEAIERIEWLLAQDEREGLGARVFCVPG
ncbi:hypothetical protein C7459_111133 [Tumebacillus permanentifrigoris]|uniref:Uncharacterized protein n=1 Tax=Tumebacillus permanentifrigoris TaxID=378543 RepID=A0A316D862_9BACL|nr:hypothetical protein C7459_111133 [Tumebacillus permanentifrigoris]